METRKAHALGLITQGSLSAGLEMRLDKNCSVEDLRVGRFVVIEGRHSRFFSMLTDVSLATNSPQILNFPPENDPFFLDVLTGVSTFGSVKVQPMLMLEKNGHSHELRPVKTIPSHFSPVFEAKEEDFALVFGRENRQDKKDPHFEIGQPLNMDIPICVNLSRFIERSNGIFGKSGTGKSFLTRIFLCGTIKKDLASLIVFDMHNEYGWQAMSENKGQSRVKGLKQLFNEDVIVYSLDRESSKARGISDVRELYIGLDQIEIEDLDLLKTELALSEASLENAYIIKERFGQNWISLLLEMSSEEIEEFVETFKGHAGAIKALQRRLNTVVQKTAYLKPRVDQNYIEDILQQIQAGKHIVLEFGRQNNLLSYMLATNIITRRLHRQYVRLSETFLANPETNKAPRKLMIVIEEAHKFLSPQLAKQTIFGVIAREMRKYFVTLLIIDQRPSGIDPEIMSQLGTRVTALLNDDKDIDAVFTGVSGSHTLRTVLAQLDPKQQALLLGYAVPMPVVIRARNFDSSFYMDLMDKFNEDDNTGLDSEIKQRRAKQAKLELFGPGKQ